MIEAASMPLGTALDEPSISAQLHDLTDRITVRMGGYPNCIKTLRTEIPKLLKATCEQLLTEVTACKVEVEEEQAHGWQVMSIGAIKMLAEMKKGAQQNREPLAKMEEDAQQKMEPLAEMEEDAQQKMEQRMKQLPEIKKVAQQMRKKLAEDAVKANAALVMQEELRRRGGVGAMNAVVFRRPVALNIKDATNRSRMRVLETKRDDRHGNRGEKANGPNADVTFWPSVTANADGALWQSETVKANAAQNEVTASAATNVTQAMLAVSAANNVKQATQAVSAATNVKQATQAMLAAAAALGEGGAKEKEMLKQQQAAAAAEKSEQQIKIVETVLISLPPTDHTENAKSLCRIAKALVCCMSELSIESVLYTTFDKTKSYLYIDAGMSGCSVPPPSTGNGSGANVTAAFGGVTANPLTPTKSPEPQREQGEESIITLVLMFIYYHHHHHNHDHNHQHHHNQEQQHHHNQEQEQ
jgi:hypothetical protein